jgi:organic hydroperoxide reductase OsmC/OhrA
VGRVSSQREILMPEFTAVVAWRRGTRDFDPNTWDRNHEVIFPEGLSVGFSAAPEFRGDPAKLNPHGAFLAALASCHMLTFLALAARRGLVIDAYDDDPVGTLGRNEDGRLAMTEVLLRPKVTFAAGKAPHQRGLAELHHRAHRHCYMANSVRTQIRVEDRTELPEPV